jgi:uncharacterized protein YjdB
MSVTPPQLVSITLNPLSVTLAIGQLANFTATASFSDGSTQDVTASAHWSVTNPLLANISNTLGTAGQLTGVATGATSVSASLNGVSGSANLTVNAAVLTSITVGPANLSLALGTSSGLTATGVFTDGSTQDLTATVGWTTSNPLILSVNSTGIVLPIALGSATVTASVGSITGSVSVAKFKSGFTQHSASDRNAFA